MITHHLSRGRPRSRVVTSMSQTVLPPLRRVSSFPPTSFECDACDQGTLGGLSALLDSTGTAIVTRSRLPAVFRFGTGGATRATPGIASSAREERREESRSSARARRSPGRSCSLHAFGSDARRTSASWQLVEASGLKPSA